MEQRFLYKSYFVFCILMRPAISFLKSKNFQLFVKKKCSLLYPDQGILPRSGYIPRLVPFSSLNRFGKLKYMSTIVKYYQNRQICLSKVHKMTHEVWNKCISSKLQQFCNIVDRVVLPELHCCRNFDPSMLHLQVQLHLHIVQKCIFASKHSLYVI